MKAIVPGSASESGLLLASLLDAATAFSGLSVMVLQGAHVSIPNGYALGLYQLGYVVPQLITTPVAERLAQRFGALLVLSLSFLCSAASAHVVATSLAEKSLTLFFASRVLNGIFRHDKLLLKLTGAELGYGAQRFGKSVFYGMQVGLLLSGALGDLWQDAVRIQRSFVLLDLLAACLCFGALVANWGKTHPLSPTTHVSTEQYHQHVVRFLTFSGGRGNATAYAAATALLAVYFSAGVNQSLYPLMGRYFHHPLTFTGLHLTLNLYTPLVAERLKTSLLCTHQSRQPDQYRLAACAAVLLMGVWGIPYTAALGLWVYYPFSFCFVDLPAAVIAGALTASLKEAIPPYFSKDESQRLAVHIMMGMKLFSAPARMVTAAAFPAWKTSVHFLSVPACIYALAHLLVHSRTVALACCILSAAALALLNGAVSVHDVAPDL